MNHDFDVLVIGGGLAGCAMSAELRRQGFSVAMLDQPQLSACSRNATGVINPLVLRSLRVQEQLREGAGNVDFYARARAGYGPLFQDHALLHLFANPAAREHWDNRVASGEAEFLEPARDGDLPAPWEDWQFRHAWGWGPVRNAALVNVAAFLAHEQTNLATAGRLFIHALTDQEIHNYPDGIVCGRWTAKTAVFCLGWRTILSSFWSRVALKPAKGETIRVELGGPAYLPTADCQPPILHSTIQVIAHATDSSRIVRVGSTHVWDDTSETLSETARAELLYKLQCLHEGPLRVIEQRAGIRPAARDRRPIVGFHPEFPRMAILNGLGTRGILLAPGLAWLLALAISGDRRIPAIWDARRFWTTPGAT